MPDKSLMLKGLARLRAHIRFSQSVLNCVNAVVMKIRPFWGLLHRYAGLAMTVFLIIVGLTGSLLAFYNELEHAINPHLSVASNGRAPLDLADLIDGAERLSPQTKVQSIWLNDAAAQVSVAPRLRMNRAAGFWAYPPWCGRWIALLGFI